MSFSGEDQSINGNGGLHFFDFKTPLGGLLAFHSVISDDAIVVEEERKGAEGGQNRTGPEGSMLVFSVILFFCMCILNPEH